MKDILRGLKAIIFDLDGVIVNTMPFHARAWQDTFKKFNINVTKKEIYLREGEKWDKTFFDILKKNKIKITKTIKEEVFRHRENVFKNILKIRIFKDAPPLIKGLKKRGFKLALVTGTPRKEVKRILPKQLYRLFDVIIPSDEVKRGKPHPEPYRKALRALKTAPYETIVIENAPNGIIAAKRANMKVIAVETSLSKRYLKKADFILGSLSEIRLSCHCEEAAEGGRRSNLGR
ncbi:HAD family phosphatase [Omnitrophica bacterium]|nr:HAD family phosphatase [Candidatus Omnitrophota bacterium]